MLTVYLITFYTPGTLLLNCEITLYNTQYLLLLFLSIFNSFVYSVNMFFVSAG